MGRFSPLCRKSGGMANPWKGVWLPGASKSAVDKQLRPERETEKRKGRCRFVIDESGRRCSKPVLNNCHVIPESSVLKELKDEKSGKVLEMQWGVGGWVDFYLRSSEANLVDPTEPDSFEPQPVGTGDASVRWFACKHLDEGIDHDGEFGPIDVKEPDFEDPIVRLLYMYRAALCEVDLCRLGRDLIAGRDHFARAHQYTYARSQWSAFKDFLRVRTRTAGATANRLGKMWFLCKTRDVISADAFSWQQLCFRSSLDFAACIFNYGDGIVANVVPVGQSWHKMTLLHWTNDTDSIGRAKTRLVQLGRGTHVSLNYGVSVLSELMTNGAGMVAASPRSYDGLPCDEKLAIKKIVAKNSGAEVIARLLSPQRPWPSGAAQTYRHVRRWR